jgi:hypothetical protein
LDEHDSSLSVAFDIPGRDCECCVLSSKVLIAVHIRFDEASDRCATFDYCLLFHDRVNVFSMTVALSRYYRESHF